MKSTLSNLYNMGLNELHILDTILLNIHPFHLWRIRITCKLFVEEIKNITYLLYQKWVVNLPLQQIKIDTRNWSPNKLVEFASHVHPIPSYHITNEKLMNSVVFNYLKLHYPEYVINYYYDMSSGYQNPITFLYYCWKYDYRSLRKKWMDNYPYFINHIMNNIYEAYFTHGFLRRYYIETEYMNKIIICGSLLNSTDIPPEDLINIIAMCLNYDIDDIAKRDLKEGIECQIHTGGNIYKLIGYKLTIQFTKQQVQTLLNKLGIVATIPERTAIDMKWTRKYRLSYKWNFDPKLMYSTLNEEKKVTFMKMLAWNRPDLYIKIPEGWTTELNSHITHPYYIYYMQSYQN